jgi:N-acetylmuramoyl-L-alanine amidase
LQVRILPGPPHHTITGGDDTDISRRSRRGASTASKSRSDRRDAILRQRRFVVIPVVAILAVGLVAAGVALALAEVGKPSTVLSRTADEATPLPDKTLAGADWSSTAGTSLGTTSAIDVEVPDVVGKPMATAEALLQAAGFKTQTRVSDTAIAGVEPNEVVAQWPNAGARLRAGERVVITYQSAGAAIAGGKPLVVVIDAGHQATSDSGLEPNWPGAAQKDWKTKVAGGAPGEYKLALIISVKLFDRLQAKGIKVVMVRTSNDVNISNVARAEIGNKANADLVVRIHLDSSTNRDVHGISTLYPSGSHLRAPIGPASMRAARLVEDAVIAATRARSFPLSPRSDMTGFNWSTRPTIIVECGFMSNTVEGGWCATDAYQNKLADGISAGVLRYLGTSDQAR